MGKTVLTLMLCCLAASAAFAQTGGYSSETYTEEEYIAYQLEVSSRVLDEVSSIFERFSLAEIEADPAMEKVNLLTHEFEKSLPLVTKEGKKLHELMRSLLSHVENYLIHFKRTDRENPELNARIIELKRALNEEMVRLHYIADQG